MTDAPTTRSRRIVRRAVWTLAGVVLLVVWYVAAWIVVSRAAQDGTISLQTAQRVRPAFAPLIAYCESDRPGARLVSDLWWRINQPSVETLSERLVPVMSSEVRLAAIRIVLLSPSPLAPQRLPMANDD